MSMTAMAISSFLPMWQHRLEAVLAVLRGEPGQQVADRFRMARSDLYKFRSRALQAVRQALRDQPRGPKRLAQSALAPSARRWLLRTCINIPPGVPVSSMSNWETRHLIPEPLIASVSAMA